MYCEKRSPNSLKIFHGIGILFFSGSSDSSLFYRHCNSICVHRLSRGFTNTIDECQEFCIKSDSCYAFSYSILHDCYFCWTYLTQKPKKGNFYTHVKKGVVSPG